MWSFGCILYELIKYTLKGNKQEAEFKKERYLLDGTSCFPLSPVKNEKKDETAVIAQED